MLGFEFELRVILSKHPGGSTEEEEEKLAADDERPFSAVQDYATGAGLSVAGKIGRPAISSILELVTKPVDEFAGEDVVLAPVRAAKGRRRPHRDPHWRPPHSDQGKRRLPGRGGRSSTRPDRVEGEDAFQSTAASVRTAYALRLGQVPQLMHEMTTGAMSKRVGETEQTVLAEALKNTGKVMSRLVGLDAKTAPNFYGLLHLISLYLTGGHPDHRASLDKNQGRSSSATSWALSRASSRSASSCSWRVTGWRRSRPTSSRRTGGSRTNRSSSTTRRAHGRSTGSGQC